MEQLLDATAELAELEDYRTIEQLPVPRSSEWDRIEPTSSKNSGTFFPEVNGVEPEENQKERSEEIRRRISEGLGKGRWDVLAWYEPFHPFAYSRSNDSFRHVHRWGIFIRNSAIETLAGVFQEHGLDPIQAFNVASTFLFRHEATHFEHELLITHAEIASSHPAYLADAVAMHHSSQGYGPATEGLCNAKALSSLPKDVQKIIKLWLKNQLPGYRDWQQHSSRLRGASWREVIEEHRKLRTLHPAGLKALRKTSGVPPLSKYNFETLLEDVPVYFVPDGSGPNGSVFGAILGPIVPLETPSFWKDLGSKGDLKRMQIAWERTKERLASGALNSVHFERLKDLRQPTFSVRVDGQGNKGARAALVRDSGWHAVAIDRDHDKLYQRIKRISPISLT